MNGAFSFVIAPALMVMMSVTKLPTVIQAEGNQFSGTNQ
jgi:hypothetical protein